jgi:hypothetical protein
MYGYIIMDDDEMNNLGLVEIIPGQLVDFNINLRGRYNLRLVFARDNAPDINQIINISNIVPRDVPRHYIIEYTVEHFSLDEYPDNMWHPAFPVLPEHLTETLEVIQSINGLLRTTTAPQRVVQLFQLASNNGNNGGKKRKSNRTKKPKRKRRRTRSKMSKRV